MINLASQAKKDAKLAAKTTAATPLANAGLAVAVTGLGVGGILAVTNPMNAIDDDDDELAELGEPVDDDQARTPPRLHTTTAHSVLHVRYNVHRSLMCVMCAHSRWKIHSLQVPVRSRPQLPQH